VKYFLKSAAEPTHTHTPNKHYYSSSGGFKPHVLKMAKAILFHLCVCCPSLSLSLTHTHTVSSSSLNLRLAFRSAGSVSTAVNPSLSTAQKREKEKISFFVTSLPLSSLTGSDGESACVCNSQKTADPETLMTIRTCAWNNNRSVSGSCSSHAYLCFSLSRGRKRRRRKGDGVLPWNETFLMYFYNTICYRLETVGGGFEKQPP